MSNNPLFQNINRPDGLQARIIQDIEYLKTIQSEQDFNITINNIINNITYITNKVIYINNVPNYYAVGFSFKDLNIKFNSLPIPINYSAGFNVIEKDNTFSIPL